MKNVTIKQDAGLNWKPSVLGDVVERIEGGGTPSKENSDYWGGSIPWASVKDIVTHNPKNTQDHITEVGLRNSSSRLVKAGTLIVPTRMSLGHAVTFDVDVAINQDLKALYPKESLERKYLYYWFQSKKKFIERLGSGSTVTGIQVGDLKSIKFDLPPKPEQDRIVAVLVTWDRAIEKLKRKIEIKKEVKKGLMQELLTGKTRLSGFTEKWKKVKLRDISVNLDNRRVPLNSEDRAMRKGDIPYCGANGVVDYIDQYIFDEDIILVAEDGGQFDEYQTRPIAYRMSGKSWVNNHAHVIKARSNFSQDLLFYLTVHKNILRYLNGGTRAKLNKSELLNIEYYVPSSSQEQEELAGLFNLVDKEIYLLEKILKKLTDQKRYLLNNLITGTIRTPETLSIHK